MQGDIDLFFTDETGFNLTPSIPYGWLPEGEQVSIESSKTKVTNIFGLLSKQGKLKTYWTDKSIDSDFVISCIDEFALTVDNTTVLLMDNAPWHKSEKVIKKQQEWEQKDIYLFFIPPYSPKLNLIEILWRKIKYEWLKAKDYLSKASLIEALKNIIEQYTHDYCINFSENFK